LTATTEIAAVDRSFFLKDRLIYAFGCAEMAA
jgi:hypothetical protein